MENEKGPTDSVPQKLIELQGQTRLLVEIHSKPNPLLQDIPNASRPDLPAIFKGPQHD
jgi:hypothetical protein